MVDSKFPLQEWRIVGFSALLVGTICAFVALIHGVDEAGMRIAMMLRFAAGRRKEKLV